MRHKTQSTRRRTHLRLTTSPRTRKQRLWWETRFLQDLRHQLGARTTIHQHHLSMKSAEELATWMHTSISKRAAAHQQMSFWPHSPVGDAILQRPVSRFVTVESPIVSDEEQDAPRAEQHNGTPPATVQGIADHPEFVAEVIAIVNQDLTDCILQLTRVARRQVSVNTLGRWMLDEPLRTRLFNVDDEDGEWTYRTGPQ